MIVADVISRLMMLLTHLMSLLFPATFAVDPDCNYYQTMNQGVTYYVYNKEYPGSYGAGKTCRWVGVAPANMLVQLDCQLEIPQSSGCQQDRLMVSTTGNINLENAHSYCGFGNFSIKSDYNNITIGLISAWNTQGGRFLCTMKAVSKPAPPQCDCGWKNIRRIVGGIETKVNEFPSMAGVVDFLIRDVICGATIVATKYAITAAHCVRNKQATSVGLLVGDHNISSGAETSATALILINRFIIYPGYDPNNPVVVDDIAVLETANPITFSMLVGPACLPFRYYTETFAGKSAELLGWGTTEFTGPKSDVLLKTDVNVLSPENCSIQAGGNINQICTYKTGHDACQSDSGGPVLWQDPNSYRTQLIGVISTGIGCASSTPSINTRITSYLNWILQVTPDVDYCVK